MLLCGQNTVSTLLNSIATRSLVPDGPAPFNLQTGVLLQEASKIFACIAVVFASGERASAIMSSGREWARSATIGLCYLLQNNLLMIAMQHLDPTIFAVTQKLGLLFAALLSVSILDAHISCLRWFALLQLCVGVALVQHSNHKTPHTASERALDGSGDSSFGQMVGLAATVCASLMSALAGVYCEKMFKGSEISIWVRNVHFSVCGCLFGTVGLAVTGDLPQIRQDGFFGGYSEIVVVAILTNALGGILVSVAIKHVNVVASNFTKSVALVLIAVYSVLFLGHVSGTAFVAGLALVCGSTVLYAVDPPLSEFGLCLSDRQFVCAAPLKGVEYLALLFGTYAVASAIGTYIAFGAAWHPMVLQQEPTGGEPPSMLQIG